MTEGWFGILDIVGYVGYVFYSEDNWESNFARLQKIRKEYLPNAYYPYYVYGSSRDEIYKLMKDKCILAIVKDV